VEVALGLAVVQDSAAAEQQEPEPADLVAQLVPQRRPGIHHPIDVVVAPRVSRVPGEHRQLHVGKRFAELFERHREDRLVADVQTPVRAADAHRRGAPLKASIFGGRVRGVSVRRGANVARRDDDRLLVAPRATGSRC
jgi:hypothetical protein